MDYKIVLKEKEAQPVLSIRKTTSVGNLPEEIGKAYESILQYLNELGEKPAEAPFTAYYNMDMEHLDVEMGFPVAEPLKGRDEIKSGEIPAGKYTECMYKGPYEEMTLPYDAMNRWISENGHIPTGVTYEVYYNSPADVPEIELLTKIMFQIK